MDYSILDDPNALAELLASATPEQRVLQRAREWDDQTLAIEIAMIGHREKWTEWRKRVLRMSDHELTQELKSLTADLEPHVE
jgi:predicted RNA-binding protein with PIN domain